MVLRIAALRQGRHGLAAPTSRLARRQLTTRVASIDAKPSHAVPQWSEVDTKSIVDDEPLPVSVPTASKRKKQQKILQSKIMQLAINPAHEHHGRAWTQPTKLQGAEPGAKQTLSPQQQWTEFKQVQAFTRKLGSVVDKKYVPTEIISNPPAPEDVTLELLMASQTHMGHHTSLWNPANARYIYGVRQNVHMIALEVTAAHLRRAARVVEEVIYNGGLVLFAGTRQGQMEIVTKAAEMAGACHLFTKWTPGGITNRDVILRTKQKKVVNHLDEELAGFNQYMSQSRPLLPDLVVCLNPKDNYTLLYECGLKDIPTIGVIDTNTDPSWVTYTIPANDDSLRSTALIGGVLGRAGEAGKARRLADAKSGRVPWSTPADVHKFMQLERDAAVSKHKEVMGRQQTVVGFTEEEDRILRSMNELHTKELNEDDMVAAMRQMGGADEVPQKPMPEAKGQESSLSAELRGFQGELESLSANIEALNASLPTTGRDKLLDLLQSKD